MDVEYSTSESNVVQSIIRSSISHEKNMNSKPTAYIERKRNLVPVVPASKNKDRKFRKRGVTKSPVKQDVAKHYSQDNMRNQIGDEESVGKSSSLSVKPGEPWNSVWAKMRQKGWKHVRGNLEHANFYVKPGKLKSKGKFNDDYFSSDGVKNYLKVYYNWTEEDHANSSSRSIRSYVSSARIPTNEDFMKKKYNWQVDQT